MRYLGYTATTSQITLWWDTVANVTVTRVTRRPGVNVPENRNRTSATDTPRSGSPQQYQLSFQNKTVWAQTASFSTSTIFAERHPGIVAGEPAPVAAAVSTEAEVVPELPAIPAFPHIFDLLVFEGNFIGHYVRTDTAGNWKRVDRLNLPPGTQVPDTATFLIQSFTALEHLNAVALLQSPKGNTLVSFEFKPGTGEHQPIPVATDQGPVSQVSGIPAFVQTDQELFHLLVPVSIQPGVDQIIDIIHDSKTIQGSWQQVATLPVPAGTSVDSIALVQGDSEGSLKAVVRLRPFEGEDILVSYQSNPEFRWQGPFDITTGLQISTEREPGTLTQITGAPGLFHSIVGAQEQLDLLVPTSISGSTQIIQLTQPAGPGTSINAPWTQTATLPLFANDSRTQVISISLIQDDQGNLQAITHESTSGAKNLLTFYLFQQGKWGQPSLVTGPHGKPLVVGQDNGPSGGNGGHDGDGDNGDHGGDGEHDGRLD